MKRLIRIIPILALLFVGISRMWSRSVASVAAKAVPAQQSSPLTTQYFYDNNGRLTAVVMADGTGVEYSYDPAGNITSITVPSLGIFSYTPTGGIAGKIAGTSVTFTGIGMPSVTSVTFATGGTPIPANFTVNSPNLTAVVPSGVDTTPGAVNITLTSPQTSISVPFNIFIGS